MSRSMPPPPTKFAAAPSLQRATAQAARRPSLSMPPPPTKFGAPIGLQRAQAPPRPVSPGPLPPPTKFGATPGLKPASGHTGWIVQRARAAPAPVVNTVDFFDRIGATEASGVTFHAWMGQDPAPEMAASATRDDFDKNGKATIAALAALTNQTKAVEGTVYDVVDLGLRLAHNSGRSLFQYMFNALSTAALNYKNGPLHRNEEEKLPTTDNDWRYMELYYCGGGTRLIIDTKLWLAFVSMHYGKFYVLTNGGQNPITQNQAVVVECRILSVAFKTGNWKPFAAVYPGKLAAMMKTGPAPVDKTGETPAAAASTS